ncbi:MAG: glycosyltransferase [Rikenellaceae bacterium]
MNNKLDVIVTIRCITYNHEPYIRECLEGFVMQQTNFKFEAVVHDDASTDGTAAIIAEFAEKYPDIIKPLYETENQYSKKDGSLQRIMTAHMRGKYIAMCEGDDYWTDPHKLQKQVDFLEANPEYGLCFTNVDRYREDDKSCISSFFKESIRTEIKSLNNYILRGVWLATCTWVLRTELYSQYQAWMGTRQYSLGDLAIVSYILSRSKVEYLSDVTSVYRIHDGGVSNSKSARVQYEFALSCLQLNQYICSTLLASHSDILSTIENRAIQDQLKNILFYEKKEAGIKYLKLVEFFNIKGFKVSSRIIIKYYNLFVFIVTLEKKYANMFVNEK